MRSNFHYQPNSELSAAAASIMEELKRTDEELEQKRKLMDLKKKEQALIKLEDSKYQDNHKLKEQFYQITPKNQNQNQFNPRDKDFFSKFSNNNDEHLKKQMYRNQLDKQVEHKRHQSIEKQKRQQLADEVWKNLPKYKPQAQSRTRSPSRNQYQSTKQPVEQTAFGREQVSRHPRSSRALEMVGLSNQQERQKKLKEQKVKQYYKELQEQRQEQKRRKQQQKKLQKQKKIQFQGATFTEVSTRKQKSKKPPTQNMKTSFTTNKLNMYQQELRGIKQKYKKGLIDIEQYQKSQRLLQLRYNKEQQFKPLLNQVKNNDVYNLTQYNPQQNRQQERDRDRDRDRERERQRERERERQKKINIFVHKPEPVEPTNRSFIGASRQSYSESLLQQPTQYQPIYPSPQIPSQPQPNQQMFQTNNSLPTLDPFQYANILQQNQLQMFQKMIDGMKDIITTTFLYDRKKVQQPQKNVNTIEKQYQSVPRQAPFRQFRSPELTKINSPSPRNMEPSLSLQNIKMVYQSIDESKNFFKKPIKIKGFKQFQYVQKMGGSTVQIPSTSCFVTSNDGFQKLQKCFQKDLILMKHLQLNQHIEDIKQSKPYFIKKKNPEQLETGNFKSLAIEKKLYKPEHEQIPLKQQQLEQLEIYKPQINQPKKWQKSGDLKKHQIGYSPSQKKIRRQNTQEVVETIEANINTKKNTLEEQFQKGIQDRIKLPTFLELDDIAQLRNQLKKEPQQRPAILQRSTYQAKKPVIIINEPEQQSYQFRAPKTKRVNQPSQIISDYQSSQLDAFLKPHQGSGNKYSKFHTIDVNNVQQSVNAYSNYEQSMPQLDSNILKLSRKKMSQIKKNKDNLLFDFMSLSEKNGSSDYRIVQNNDTYQEDVTERIEDPYTSKKRNSKYSRFRQQNEHQESQTLLSKFQESNLKDQSELNYSREPSSLTSLQQARKKAKQVRNRDKKQGSLLSINTLQQLQREIKRKDTIEQHQVKKLPPPALLKNPKQLLGMLQEMVDEDEEYPGDFDSYQEN